MYQVSKIFYFVTKLYMFRASSVAVIRSYQLYTWQLVCFMQVMWPLPRRVTLFQLDKIKNFGYLMDLVGYLYEDYHDARSLEHKEQFLFSLQQLPTSEEMKLSN